MASTQPSEYFNASEYVSDYESETASQADNRSDISRSELPPLKDPDLVAKPAPARASFSGSKSVLDEEQRRVHNAAVRHQLLSLSAYDRHRKLVNDYLQYYGGSWADFKRDSTTDRRDIDVIRDHGRFLWSEKDEPKCWSERLAKRYWDKLFKEYCLVDLSRYKENKFGMRWRVEKEVVSGKGQFTCGNVHCTEGKEAGLRSWEVNFAYKERGERRNALVKLRLCRNCSDKLNYRYKRRDVTGQKVVPEEEPSTEKDSHPTEEPDSKRSKLSEMDEKQTDVWRAVPNSQSTQSGMPKTQEEEFDEYFADMLL